MLLFVDSVAHYSNAQLGQKWNLQDSGNCFTTTGRRAGQSAIRVQMNLHGNGDQYGVYRLLGGTHSTIIVGFSLKWSNIQSTNSAPNSAAVIASLFSGSGANLEFTLQLDGSGNLYLCRNVGTTLAIASQALISGKWYYVEFKVKVHSTLGTADLRVQAPGSFTSTSWASFSGNTSSSGASFADTVGFGKALVGGGPLLFRNPDVTFCDIYIADTAAGQVADFIGPSMVSAVMPSSTVQAQWTAEGAASDLAVVQRNPYDTTKDIFANVAGNQDLYGHVLPTPLPTIIGVQGVVAGIKDGQLTRKIQTTAVSDDGSATVDSLAEDTTTALTTSAKFYCATLEAAAATSSAASTVKIPAGGNLQAGPLAA